ncbi:MAG: allantoinase AllB [Candidatus Cryosericum sp.]
MQTLFQNAQIAQPDGSLLAVDILVTDGIIEKFIPAGQEPVPESIATTDLHGLFVMPGGVDGHVHFDDPGFTEREDFATGTMQAAAGGVTTIVDMPCTSLPPVTTGDNFRTKLRAVESKAYVDYAFWGGTTPTFIESGAYRRLLPELKELGVVGIKAYTISGMQTYPRLDTRQMVMLFEAARDFNLLVAIHAEDYFLATYYTDKIIREGRTDPLAYKDGRTYDAEPLAISTVLALARREQTRVHIVHMSTSAGVDLIRQAKGQGIDATGETCPHYLLLNRDDFARLGSIAKCTPPLREHYDNEVLWAGLLDGTVDYVTTDHAAGIYPREKVTDNIWQAYAGMPGVQLRVPLMVQEAFHARGMNLYRLGEVLSTNPAKRLGLFPRKGVLAVGSDADFACIDLDAEWTVHAQGLFAKNKYTPFEGRAVRGAVRRTFVRGTCVYDGDAVFPAGPGYGNFVKSI